MITFIGADVASRLFPGLDPIGRTILLSNRPFEIVGVAKPIGTVSGQSQDVFAYVPITTLLKIYGTTAG
jgi:putative ABC transport system permease protein